MRDRKDLIKGRGTPYGTDPVRETLFFAFPRGDAFHWLYKYP